MSNDFRNRTLMVQPQLHIPCQRRGISANSERARKLGRSTGRPRLQRAIGPGSINVKSELAQLLRSGNQAGAANLIASDRCVAPKAKAIGAV